MCSFNGLVKILMPFSLFMLGTETDYTPRPTLNYPFGETLSVLATLIDGALKKGEFAKEQAYYFESPHAALFNGPNFSGSNVNDIILRALNRALDAISKGESIINIIGHSRGGCISLLIAHYLKFIQQECENGKTVIEIIKLLENEENVANTSHLFKSLNIVTTKLRGMNLSNLKNIKINLFTLDPVPGNPIHITENSSGVLKRIAQNTNWYNKHFFKLPPINNCTSLYYQDETSVGFCPIVFKIPESQGQYQLDSIPGHHGLGSSGKPVNQKNQPLPKNDGLENIQKLVFAKMALFLLDNGVRFNEASAYYKKLELRQTITTILNNENISLNELTSYKDAFLLALYKIIRASKNNLTTLRQSNYGLGSNGLERKALINVDEEGIFETKMLSTILPPRGRFVNREHAYLESKNLLANFNIPFYLPYPLIQAINKILEQPQISDENNALILEQFINSITEKYLGVDREDKEEFFECLTKTIEIFGSSYRIKDWINKAISKYRASLSAKYDFLQYLFSPIERLEVAFTTLICDQSEDEIFKAWNIFRLKGEIKATENEQDIELRKKRIWDNLADVFPGHNLETVEMAFNDNLIKGAKDLFFSLKMAEEELSKISKIPEFNDHKIDDIQSMSLVLLDKYPEINTRTLKPLSNNKSTFFKPPIYDHQLSENNKKLIDEYYTHLKLTTLFYLDYLKDEEKKLTDEDKEKIAGKIKLVEDLEACLQDSEHNISIENFYVVLKNNGSALKKHRNLIWDILICGAIGFTILVTGVFIGILALAFYSNANPIRSMFFWQTKGENYLESVDKDFDKVKSLLSFG